MGEPVLAGNPANGDQLVFEPSCTGTTPILAAASSEFASQAVNMVLPLHQSVLYPTDESLPGYWFVKTGWHIPSVTAKLSHHCPALLTLYTCFAPLHSHAFPKAQ